MFRNYLMAALRNLARHRLHSAISIFGLAMGLCGAMLAGLVLRAELSYDRFIPSYERTYQAEFITAPSGRAPRHNPLSPIWLAEQMKLRFSEVEAVTRIAEAEATVKRGDIEAKENIAWADANLFDVLPMPVLSGDLSTALKRADAVVLTRDSARKYFGREDPIGETLLIDGDFPITVVAVVENLPDNSTLVRTGFYVSGSSARSVWTQFDAPFNKNADSFRFPGRTYLRLASAASFESLQRGMPDFSRDVFPTWLQDTHPTIGLVRLDLVHRHPGFNPDVQTRLVIVGVVGGLILIVGCLNFINLTTARSARRALEVGIRKAAGAERRALMIQFLGESLVCVMLAAALAVAAAEWLLPRMNAFLGSNATFGYFSEPSLGLTVLAGVVLVGLLAGAYPAFVLAGFRPAGVIRAQRVPHRGDRVRQSLVTLQFAVLIGLMIAAGVTWQQLRFATREVLRVDTDQVLVVRSPCNVAFKAEVQALAGVSAAACTSEMLLANRMYAMADTKDGVSISLNTINVEPGLLDMFVNPVAGRLFSAERDPIKSTEKEVSIAGRLVINETAAARLGFASPEAALGQVLSGRSFRQGNADEIIGVVPDFSFGPATDAIPATIYSIAPPRLDRIFVRLRGQAIPETLAAVDNLWRDSGAEGPIDRIFLNDHIRQLYLSVQRQTQTLTVFSACALLLACLGLVGLAASAAERRTKEIGVRKAMGASTSDVMRLLMWQSTRPVLWASLIAWPVAAFAMSEWLQGFAYRVDLDPLLFIGAPVVALLIALSTVSGQCYFVAREKPVRALRYE